MTNASKVSFAGTIGKQDAQIARLDEKLSRMEGMLEQVLHMLCTMQERPSHDHGMPSLQHDGKPSMDAACGLPPVCHDKGTPKLSLQHASGILGRDVAGARLDHAEGPKLTGSLSAMPNDSAEAITNCSGSAAPPPHDSSSPHAAESPIRDDLQTPPETAASTLLPPELQHTAEDEHSSLNPTSPHNKLPTTLPFYGAAQTVSPTANSATPPRQLQHSSAPLIASAPAMASLSAGVGSISSSLPLNRLSVPVLPAMNHSSELAAAGTGVGARHPAFHDIVLMAQERKHRQVKLLRKLSSRSPGTMAPLPEEGPAPEPGTEQQQQQQQLCQNQQQQQWQLSQNHHHQQQQLCQQQQKQQQLQQEDEAGLHHGTPSPPSMSWFEAQSAVVQIRVDGSFSAGSPAVQVKSALPVHKQLQIKQNHQANGRTWGDAVQPIDMLVARPLESKQPRHRSFIGGDSVLVRMASAAAAENEAQRMVSRQQDPAWHRCMVYLYKALKALVWDIVDPDNPWRLRWDFIMIFMMLYIALVTPYLIAFNISTVDVKSEIFAVDMSVNGVLMLDVLLNFRTAYIDERGDMIRSRVRVVLHYLFTWFLPDLLGSLPYDNIFSLYGLGVIKVLRLLRIFRFLRSLEVLKLRQMMRQPNSPSLMQSLEIKIGLANVGLLKFALLAAVSMHWAACLFYYAASWSHFSGDTWVGQADLASVDATTGKPQPAAGDITKYIYSLYWAVATMATVGYGDIAAVSVYEKVIAIIVIIVGTSMFAFFMGSMANLIASSNGHTARQTHKRQEVEEFLTMRGIPKKLSSQIRSFYDYKMAREMFEVEHQLITNLSRSLRTQVITHLYLPTLEQVPLFKGRHPHFITALCDLLKMEYYAPGDVVVRQGEVAEEMYFIMEGSLEVRVYDKDLNFSTFSVSQPREMEEGFTKRKMKGMKKVFSKLSRKRPASAPPCSAFQEADLHEAGLQYKEVGMLEAGGVFGTYSCLLGEPRAATVVAVQYCKVYSLSYSDLEHLVEQWPELAEEFNNYVGDKTHNVEDEAWHVRHQMGLSGRGTDLIYPSPMQV